MATPAGIVGDFLSCWSKPGGLAEGVHRNEPGMMRGAAKC